MMECAASKQEERGKNRQDVGVVGILNFLDVLGAVLASTLMQQFISAMA